jgi:hypothetical protein
MGSFLEKIAKRIANAKGGHSAVVDGLTMTGDTPNAVVINPDIQMRTEGFKRFLSLVVEAKKKDLAAEPEDQEEGTQNKAGVLHEALVHRALVNNHGAGAITFNDGRETVDQAHDRIASDLFGADYASHTKYKDMASKAAGTAETIVKNEGPRYKPTSSKVAWSSKHGDVERVTGKKTTQSGDASDLYIDHTHLTDPKERYSGISLKTVNKKKGTAPVSAGGLGSHDKTFGIDSSAHIDNAKKEVMDLHKDKFEAAKDKNGKLTSSAAKALMKNHPEIAKAERGSRTKALQSIASGYVGAFEQMDPKKRGEVLRESMRANDTGFRHTRITSGGSNNDYDHKVQQPVTEHNQYLNDPDNLHAEIHGGNGIHTFHLDPKTGVKTYLHKIRFKAAGSAGIFGSTKTSGEGYMKQPKSIDKATGRHSDPDHPVQVETETSPAPAASENKPAASSSEPERHHTLFWGRANPPHAGHEQAYNVVKKVARKNGGTSSMVLSRTHDTKRNPLTPEQKEKHAKRAFPDVNTSVADPEHNGFLQQLSKIHEQGVTHLHMVAGSDRHKEYSALINRYNGVKGSHGYYNFKNVTLHSAGERDADAEGTAGVSATTQRMHAAAGRHKEFAKNAPSTMKPGHAKELYNDVRSGMSGPSATVKKIIKRAK